jgi:hypothetical protein
MSRAGSLNHDELMSHFSQARPLACSGLWWISGARRCSEPLREHMDVLSGNRPSRNSLAERLDAYAVGQLMALAASTELQCRVLLGSQQFCRAADSGVQNMRLYKSAAKCVAQTGASVQGFNTGTGYVGSLSQIRKVVSSLILAIWLCQILHVRLCCENTDVLCAPDYSLRFASGPSASGFLFKHPSLDR